MALSAGPDAQFLYKVVGMAGTCLGKTAQAAAITFLTLLRLLLSASIHRVGKVQA